MSETNISSRYRCDFSCERAGRILAGCGFIAGAIFGYVHHPAWFFIMGFGTAFNLILSGITDRCAVKSMLVKLGLPSERELGADTHRDRNTGFLSLHADNTEHT